MSTTEELLQQLKSGQLSLEECQKQIEKKTAKSNAVECKVTPKGCIGFYGLRRMPISVYIEELESILDTVLEEDYKTHISYNETFQQFLDDHKSTIKRKN